MTSAERQVTQAIRKMELGFVKAHGAVESSLCFNHGRRVARNVEYVRGGRRASWPDAQ